MDNFSQLQMLFNQQLSEYHEIKDIRSRLRVSEDRHQALCEEIQQLLVRDKVPPDVAPAPASENIVRPSIESAGSGIFNNAGCCRCLKFVCICSALDFEPEEFGY